MFDHLINFLLQYSLYPLLFHSRAAPFICVVMGHCKEKGEIQALDERNRADEGGYTSARTVRFVLTVTEIESSTSGTNRSNHHRPHPVRFCSVL